MDLIHQLAYLQLVEERRAEIARDRRAPYFVAGERVRRRERHPGRVRRGMGRILVGAGRRLLHAEGIAR